jgi:hypothetical protein
MTPPLPAIGMPGTTSPACGCSLGRRAPTSHFRYWSVVPWDVALPPATSGTGMTIQLTSRDDPLPPSSQPSPAIPGRPPAPSKATATPGTTHLTAIPRDDHGLSFGRRRPTSQSFSTKTPPEPPLDGSPSLVTHCQPRPSLGYPPKRPSPSLPLLHLLETRAI